MQPKSLKQLLEWQAPAVPMLLGPYLLPKGSVMFTYGEEGTLKSWLMIDLTFRIGTGERWLGWTTAKSRVLTINPELTEAVYQGRIKTYMQRRGLNGGTPDNIFFATDLDLKLDQAYGLHELEVAIQQVSPDVLIVDGLYKVVSTDVTAGGDARHLIDNVDRLRKKYGISVIIVHHARQEKYDEAEGKLDQGTSEMYGSSWYKNWADVIMRLRKEADHVGNEYLTVGWQKHRHSIDIPPTLKFYFDRPKLRLWIV